MWTQSLRAGLAVVVLVGCASTAQEPLSSPPSPEAAAPTQAAPEAGGDEETSGPADGLACGVSLPRDLSSEDEIAQTLVIFQPAGGELESPWAPRLGGVFLEQPDVPPYLLEFKQESVFAPFIAVDDEGGRVQWREDASVPLDAPLDLGRLTSEEIREATRLRGESLRSQGIDVTFAPVVDLYPGSRDGVIGDRAFSSEPEEVTALARVYAEGFEEADVITTLKHFPGHGRADGDSHVGLPVTPEWQDMLTRDIAPFRDLIQDDSDLRWVMMGHLDVPGLTRGKPASLSPAAYEYLRDDLGHAGLVVTDEISGMQAVAGDYSTEDAVIRALDAGADLVLIADPGDLGGLIANVADAIEADRLARERVQDAAQRVLIAKACARS